MNFTDPDSRLMADGAICYVPPERYVKEPPAAASASASASASQGPYRPGGDRSGHPFIRHEKPVAEDLGPAFRSYGPTQPTPRRTRDTGWSTFR